MNAPERFRNKAGRGILEGIQTVNDQVKTHFPGFHPGLLEYGLTGLKGNQENHWNFLSH